MPIDSQLFDAGEHRCSIEGEILDLLQSDPRQAYDAREVTMEVMGLGVAERNVDRPSDLQAIVAEFVDVATVTAILDRLVDRGLVERRVVDTGKGVRSYPPGRDLLDSCRHGPGVSRVELTNPVS